MVMDGPTNRHAFHSDVRHVLIPTLRPGDIVVRDNLPAHKGAETRMMIEAVRANLIFLPLYSPDLQHD
jgi:putative transposase